MGGPVPPVNATSLAMRVSPHDRPLLSDPEFPKLVIDLFAALHERKPFLDPADVLGTVGALRDAARARAGACADQLDLTGTSTALAEARAWNETLAAFRNFRP